MGRQRIVGGEPEQPPSGSAGASEPVVTAEQVEQFAADMVALSGGVLKLGPAVRELAARMAPIAAAAEQVRLERAERPYQTEVLPQTAQLWAVNDHGVIGFVVGWKWTRPPGFTGAEPIPGVQLDPVVCWVGMGMALDHPAVGQRAVVAVQVYDRESEARTAAAAMLAKRTETRNRIAEVVARRASADRPSKGDAPPG